MFKLLNDAFTILEEKSKVGDYVEKKIWRKIEQYKNLPITNLRKYDLTIEKRLIYSVLAKNSSIGREEEEILILEWFSDHKKYEQRFGY